MSLVASPAQTLNARIVAHTPTEDMMADMLERFHALTLSAGLSTDRGFEYARAYHRMADLILELTGTDPRPSDEVEG